MKDGTRGASIPIFKVFITTLRLSCCVCLQHIYMSFGKSRIIPEMFSTCVSQMRLCSDLLVFYYYLAR